MMANKPNKKMPAKPMQVKQAGKKQDSSGFLKWAPAAILIFTALLYTRALFNGFANLDDDQYIMDNPFTRDFSLNGIMSVFSSFYLDNYHPLTTLTYLFEYAWYGLNPLPYHLLNVLLHLLNTWLVFKLTEQLSGKKITAIVVSLLFAVHPMHVESVAWVSERKDVLYSLFYLLSLLVYLRYLRSGYHAKHYIGALLLFVASLLSKSAAVTLPVLLIAIDVYKGRKITARSLLEKVPFLLLSLLFGILAVLSQESVISTLPLPYGFIEKIFLFLYSIAFYIVELVTPVSLSAMHFYPDTHGGPIPWQYYASLPFLVFIAWLLLRRTSLRKEIIFGVSFFLITISVMLQVIHVGFAHTAERYTYISYIGLFYIAGQWISDIVGKKQAMPSYRIGRIAVVALFSLFIIVFSYLAYDRIGVWKDGEVLFTDVIKKNPHIHLGYYNRGNIKVHKEDYKGALPDFNKVIEYNPGFANAYICRSDILNKLSDFKGALQDMNTAIKLDSMIAITNIINRGVAYDGLGDIKSAMLDYDKAILLNPKSDQAYNNRSVIKAKTGNMQGAMSDINIAISLSPASPVAYMNRGNIKAMQKDYAGSIEDFTYSLKLKSNGMVYYNRGISRLFLKDNPGACKDLEIALKLGYEAASAMLAQNCR